ncbi:hypothetical protein FRC98_06390 [Lujinxingia vulgaris]|uniref:Uncharacterized protein n=1 Tax=Lujinxingia vulgaris TaxID=2600176 RepID=A0A5C6XDH2_9DELT|nr:hypothetical protein [Lujinxingia vulgaris]TXD38508.1 hypothetical protein FRC98_06390 [Lujinxingia vulgaris]
MRDSQTSEGRARVGQQRYPMLLGAWLVATLAGIWALEPPGAGEDARSDAASDAALPATLSSPDWQSAPTPGEAFEMRYRPHPSVGYRLVARWEEDGGGEANEASGLSLEVASLWSTGEREGDQGLEQRVEVASAALEVWGPGEPLIGFRAAQEQRALRGAVYQRAHDGMGAGGRSEWGRGGERAGAWSLALVDELHRLLSPRFPLDARLPGERWHYRLDHAGMIAALPGATSELSLAGDVRVEDRLRDYMMHQGRPALWIERRITTELRDVHETSSHDALHVKGQGEGVLLWDVESGQLILSEIAMRFELPKRSVQRSLRARITQIEGRGQNALPSLPSAY